MRLFSYIACRVRLTKKGLREPERVLGLIFQYVNILRDRGVREWIYEENRAVKKYPN
jgi:secreted Zn-dependent insulinase-like peptidase